MAARSLGTLTIDLIANIGGFAAGLNRAERQSQKWRRQVQEDVRLAGAALGAMATIAAAAAVSAGVAGINLLKTTSKQIAETDRLAKSLRMSTQDLLGWQFASQKAGVSGEQMADIFKDIGDKIGDAVLNQSGEAVDALNALGLSAKKLSTETPDRQLLAIAGALEKVGTNAEKITILESLGNDLSKLLPLFDNNSQKLQQFLKLSREYGVAPDPQSIDDLVKVNSLFEDMETQAQGLKLEIATGLARVDLSPLQAGLGDLRAVFTDPKVLQGLADMVGGIASLVGWLGKAASSLGSLIDNYQGGQKLSANASLFEVERRIRNLEADLNDEGFLAGVNRLGMDTEGKQKELNELLAQRTRLKSIAAAAPVISSATSPVTASGNYTLAPGESNGKVTPDTSAKKLESAFKSMELGYLRQIALIDTTGQKTAEVTEQQKLQFDLAEGKLTDINDAQKVRLQQLAQEVDRLNLLKKANEENAKVAEFVAGLQAQNDNARGDLSVDIQGAGLGNKQRERLRERLGIEREYLDQQRDLQKQYQAGDISQTVYDRETQALKDAQAQRLEIQEDYYSQIDALQADWVTGARDGLADWVDDSTNYATLAADAMQSALSGISSNIVDMLNGNKASWKDWGISVMKVIEQVMVNMMIANAASSIGSLFGGAASSSASSGTALQSYGANLQFNAKGGVYSSADLSQYSNSVVSSPTMFAFAKGAGLMGEAGPEAIMPLTRAADGSLGVRALGNGGVTPGSSGAPQVNIHIDGNGNTQSQASGGYEQFGKEVGNYVDRRYRELMSRDMSPGGALWYLAKGGR
ncbi:phage tail tape measure protein [Leclercia adecarboxylata]|uniref:Phage tail tape measure protein n=1 Tax=Leclercia adecarboxylata TaxID=83655 RepID=A0AAP9IT24_9ENTR|nr:phage tail tape measure protein [Leclercia adecarboxylata]QDK21162.1 phage tail tape measure protein [Leclercia adecarboxylata]